MNPRDAARELLQKISAPSWAVSVAVWTEDGQTTLVVNIDPGFRIPLDIPPTFQGFPVTVRTRTLSAATS